MDYFHSHIRNSNNPAANFYKENIDRMSNINIEVKSRRFHHTAQLCGEIDTLVCQLQNNSQMLLRDRLRHQVRSLDRCTVCREHKPIQICHVRESRPDHIHRAILTVGTTKDGMSHTVNLHDFAVQFLRQHKEEPIMFACRECHAQLDRFKRYSDEEEVIVLPRRSARIAALALKA